MAVGRTPNPCSVGSTPASPAKVLIEEAWQAFEKVEHFPEDEPDGLINLITLRNKIPRLLRELKALHDAGKKKPSPDFSDEG